LAQAERFFGNRMSAASGMWMDIDRWQARCRPREVPDGTPIVLGFDGSDTDDWTVIRAETQDGYQFTPTYGGGLPTVWNPDEWAATYGDDRVIRWYTHRPVQMHAAAERLLVDVTKAGSTFTHDGCPYTAAHIEATHKAPRPGDRYVLTKPDDGRKIDACIASIICHEAAGDVTAADKWPSDEGFYIYTASSTRRR